jgi:predicted GIY-YIG superfamily endonuclease
MKKYQVYKHTTPDGAAYIGKTCNRKRRDIQHKYCKKVTPLTEAIAKYG